jgi:uncharacterized phage-associated protein
MSSARSVAKELVRLSLTGPLPDPLTPYRLQALLYYAQAWSLLLRDSELFPDDILSAAGGPSVPAVAASITAHPDARHVCSGAFAEDPPLEEDEALFLGHLWAAYAYLSPSGLFASIQGEPPFLKAKQESTLHGKGLVGTNELRESFSRRPGIPAELDAYRCARQEMEKEAELAILTSPPLDVSAIWKGSRSVTPYALTGRGRQACRNGPQRGLSWGLPIEWPAE